MKDFQKFKALIDDETLERWDVEIREEIMPIIRETHKDDSIAQQLAFMKSYPFHTTMRLLEAYHQWSDAE